MINNIELRRYEVRDIPEMVNIWNEVVKEGNAFPQECSSGIKYACKTFI